MESALWNLEDKWKVSTKESIAFFICICSLVIGICMVTVFIRRRVATRRKGLVGQDPCSSSSSTDNDIEWSSEPKLLSSSTLRWSEPSKWEEKRSRMSHNKERVSSLLVAEGQLEGESARSEPKLLSSTLRWSGPSKWEEKRSRMSHNKERVSSLLVAEGQLEGESNRSEPKWSGPRKREDQRGRMSHNKERVPPLLVASDQLEEESNRSEPKLLSNSTLRLSEPSKWEEKKSKMSYNKKRVSPLLVAACQLEGESARWHSHNSDSPVWQRPILMGEKCELPRFSGLILYDERGRPVHHVDNDQFTINQDEYLDKKDEEGVVKEKTCEDSALAHKNEDLKEKV